MVKNDCIERATQLDYMQIKADHTSSKVLIKLSIQCDCRMVTMLMLMRVLVPFLLCLSGKNYAAANGAVIHHKP